MAQHDPPKLVQLTIDFEKLEGPAVPEAQATQPEAQKDSPSPANDAKPSDSSAVSPPPLDADPMHISHPLAKLVASLPKPTPSTGSLFPEMDTGNENARSNVKPADPSRASATQTPESDSHYKAPNFAKDKVIPDLQIATDGPASEGGPLCQEYPLAERAAQLTGYLKRNELILNRKGGLRKIKQADRAKTLEDLKVVFTHFPYQTLDFLFRTLPRHTYQNHKQTISQPQARAAVGSWIEEFPHTTGEVRSWIGVVEKQLATARKNAVPGRRLRVGKNAVNAASALITKFREIDVRRQQERDSQEGSLF